MILRHDLDPLLDALRTEFGIHSFTALEVCALHTHSDREAWRPSSADAEHAQRVREPRRDSDGVFRWSDGLGAARVICNCTLSVAYKKRCFQKASDRSCKQPTFQLGR